MEIRFLYALFIFYCVVGFVDGGGDWAGAWFAEASAHDFVGGHDDHEGVFVDVVGDAFDFGYLGEFDGYEDDFSFFVGEASLAMKEGDAPA